MLETSVIVIDGFYRDPYEVRDFALSQDFGVKGNYPGTRTRPFLQQGIGEGLQTIVGLPITYWPVDTYNGAFQVSVAGDRTWVHADHTTTWSGVVYLTPDAPAGAGTAFFRHRQTGLDSYPQEPGLRQRCDEDGSYWDRWALSDQVGNRFNRLVLFRGKRFHASQGHFGDSKENARLFQTFFFNTVY